MAVTESTFGFDGESIRIQAGDSLLTAMARAGVELGGCLCTGGDCPHCVATVDGVSYVRTCQVQAEPGMVVESHPDDGDPPLPVATSGSDVPVHHVHCDVAVIGGGAAGRAAADAARHAGRHVELLDAADGQEAIGIYAGPLVVVRTPDGMVHVHCEEVTVATGAAEIQPACPGNDLAGILTRRAAETMVGAGVDLGRVVAVGGAPTGLDAQVVEGRLVRFEGTDRVEAIVVSDPGGVEHRHACDTAVVALGTTPRDALARMGSGLAVTVVGSAAESGTIPPCPERGTICPCSGVTVDDLDSVWERGFREMELVKRATLAGTGTCQGGACLPHLRSFLADRGTELQPAFTARPVTRQLTIGEAAAGTHHRAVPRTALHQEHLRLGATMDRFGGWWRPWDYADAEAEYAAVRSRVSIGDVSTLGKMLVSGPDAVAALERLYPVAISNLRSGRSRYVLLLDERGYVADDGLVCRDSETRFTLTFTTGGSTFAEMWVRDWVSDLDVRILNQTMSVGAINVTGPRSRDLLDRAGLSNPPGYMAHSAAEVAGVPCRVFRLSFTGELSYELHHPADRSVELWQALLDLGHDLGVVPHGMEALLRLRLEKGHILIGQDTDYDSTPRRLDMGWAVDMSKPDFVGRHAIARTDRLPLDKQLVGLEMEGDSPLEGVTVWHGDDYAGYVTSACWSPVLGKSVMLAWVYLFDGVLPESVTVEGRPARRVPTPFYDPEGRRARA